MRKQLFLLIGLFLVTACATSEPASTQEVIKYGEVIFDGNECTVSGPTEVPMGRYSIVFNDTSEQPNLELYLLGFREGKGIQDMIDLQSYPGDWYPKPSWAFYGTRQYSSADKEWVHRINKAGEYMIYLGSDSPPFLWFCTQITVH